MEQQTTSTPPTTNHDRQQQPPQKQPWHRPNIVFVSLKVTENAKGSIDDGSAGRGSPPD